MMSSVRLPSDYTSHVNNLVNKINEWSIANIDWDEQQWKFINALEKFVIFLAGNQVGKSLAGGGLDAAHLTGLYNEIFGENYTGHRIPHSGKKEITLWVASIDAEFTRDNIQRHLFGLLDKKGQIQNTSEALIPYELIVDYSKHQIAQLLHPQK